MRREPLCCQGFRVYCGAGKNLGQTAEVLDGGGEKESVVRPARTTQSEPVQAKDPFEAGEEHFDLLPQLHRDHVLLGLSNTPSNLAGDLGRVGF